MDGVQLRPLTVDFHETGFVGQIAGENGQPFWFQLSDEDRQKAGRVWGPANPQALNRYCYVQNNPLGRQIRVGIIKEQQVFLSDPRRPPISRNHYLTRKTKPLKQLLLPPAAQANSDRTADALKQ
jgi:hypothetical protein